MISEDHKMLNNRRCPTRRLMSLILAVAIITFCAVYTDLLPAFTKPSKINYVIIIDAGSTGSRAHVFTLQEVESGGYKLLKDDFLPLKPGLSSFGSDAKSAAQSLKPLLDYASQKVPKTRHRDCPIEVKATAGLRILSEQVANNILQEVERFIEVNYDFKRSKKVAEIMDGTDEGIFAWISLNYFLDNWKPVPISTAALDLGGGSFQLTFETHSYNNLPQNAQKNVVTLNLAGLERKIYVKSYLGMGLKEARIRILKLAESSLTNKLTSSCLPAKYSGVWDHGGNNYEVAGTEASGYDNCLAQMKQVFDGEITVISELYGKQFYAFSYVYDKAKDSQLINDVAGAEVTVSDFVRIAKEACAAQLVNQRFQCLDTVYINYLMVHAFNLPLDYKISVVKKVNGEEISWALGAAFHVLDHSS